jgi:hypothetical protein
MAKPRMTQADSWKKRPIVLKYWDYKHDIKEWAFKNDFKYIVFFIYQCLNLGVLKRKKR